VSEGEIVSADRDSSGIDFEFDTASGLVLVRCEPGAQPISASVGRELVAAMADRGATGAFVVTVADATAALEAYIDGRRIFVVPPWELQMRVSEAIRGPKP
jgi:hypothetical protein